MHLEQVFAEKFPCPNKYILIEHTQCPGAPSPGGCEFCPGGCESAMILEVDTHEGTCRYIDYEEARSMYKQIEGRRERIAFFYAMKEIKPQLKVVKA